MPKVDVGLLSIGKQYDRVQLAELWGYESHHALGKGIVLVSGTNIILLFVTENKQTGAIPYEDKLDGNVLYMMGQRAHGTDQRLLQNLNRKQDEIHLFHRRIHHSPYTYYGRCFLIEADIKEDIPSEFVFLLQNNMDSIDDGNDMLDYFVNLPVDQNEEAMLLMEGAKMISTHIRYERNPHNRRKAIRIHGTKCKVCGFDFNHVYGKDLATDYIEVHHIKALSEGEQLIDPEKDLLPVCSNCHRMLHRKKKDNIEVEMLKNKTSLQRYIQMLSVLSEE